MEEMVEEYLKYAKGEENEKIRKINIVNTLNLIKKRYSKSNIYFNNNKKINISVRLNSIKRCINNILSNSLKFSKKIVIACNKKKGHVEIIIDDDGPGIPKKEREKVLQPFYRIEESRNRDTGGIWLVITIAADIPDTIGSKFFAIFIYIFSIIKLYTFWKDKKNDFYFS